MRQRDNTRAVWTGTLNRLWRAVGDTWVAFDTLGTPLSFGRGVSRVLMDRGGGLWEYSLDTGERRSERPAAPGAGHALTLRDLPNGPHVYRICGRDGLRRASPELVHHFEVRRDIGQEVADSVARLQAADHTGREDAARVLRGIGAAALPALRRVLDQADPEARWWFRAVIEEIERRKAE